MQSTEYSPTDAASPEPASREPDATEPASTDAAPDASAVERANEVDASPVAVAADPPLAPLPTGPSAPLDPAACAAELKRLWPALFSGAPKPLKLRIQLDIQQRAPGAFTKQALSAFFRRYTGSTSYLLAVARGKQRFDLDGQPSGEITDEHRKVANDELERRRANHESRRALEEQQRHNRAGLLHDFERTTLTRANFCALKEVAEDELDGLLAIARDEATQRREPAGRSARPQAGAARVNEREQRPGPPGGGRRN